MTAGLDANLTMTASGSTYYYLTDALGSIRQLIDANEATQNSYDYYAFGKVFGTPTENLTQPFRFTARAWDAESELYYYRFRNYDPTLGWFISRDPMGYVDGTNLYVYAGNNPVVITDAMGLYPTPGYPTPPTGPATPPVPEPVDICEILGREGCDPETIPPKTPLQAKVDWGTALGVLGKAACYDLTLTKFVIQQNTLKFTSIGMLFVDGCKDIKASLNQILGYLAYPPLDLFKGCPEGKECCYKLEVDGEHPVTITVDALVLGFLASCNVKGVVKAKVTVKGKIGQCEDKSP